MFAEQSVLHQSVLRDCSVEQGGMMGCIAHCSRLPSSLHCSSLTGQALLCPASTATANASHT